MAEAGMIQALARFRVQTPPSSVLKFFDPGGGLKALENGTIRLTPPREFNDPFEITPGIAHDHPTETDVARFFCEPYSLPRTIFFRDNPNAPERDFLRWVQSEVSKGPKAWTDWVTQARNAVIAATNDSFGISCFSESTDRFLQGPIGIRHWAFYASEHRGLAIEYDGTHQLFPLLASVKCLFRVRYLSKRKILGIAFLRNFSRDENIRNLRRIAQVKSKKAWGDEGEWRLIFKLGPAQSGGLFISRVIDGERLRPLHLLHLWAPNSTDDEKLKAARIVRRVILGVRAPSELEASVRQILSATHFENREMLWRAKLHASAAFLNQ